MAKIFGWSSMIAPKAINCQTPDTGNMETLELFAIPNSEQRWLEPGPSLIIPANFGGQAPFGFSLAN